MHTARSELRMIFKKYYLEEFVVPDMKSLCISLFGYDYITIHSM